MTSAPIAPSVRSRHMKPNRSWPGVPNRYSLISASMVMQPKSTTTVALDFGCITIDAEIKLYLFGTPGQVQLDLGVDGDATEVERDGRGRLLGDVAGAVDLGGH